MICEVTHSNARDIFLRISQSCLNISFFLEWIKMATWVVVKTAC